MARRRTAQEAPSGLQEPESRSAGVSSPPERRWALYGPLSRSAPGEVERQFELSRIVAHRAGPGHTPLVYAEQGIDRHERAVMLADARTGTFSHLLIGGASVLSPDPDTFGRLLDELHRAGVQVTIARGVAGADIAPQTGLADALIAVLRAASRTRP